MHGILRDESKEFFIQAVPSADDKTVLPRDGLHQNDEQHAKEWHGGFEVGYPIILIWHHQSMSNY